MAGSAARHTPVLILGAGPFGLSLAAHLRTLGKGFVLAGRPLSFWRDHMPSGMLLRSGLDWHLDVDEEATLEAYVAEKGLSVDDVLPLSRDLYIHYALWFADRFGLSPGVENVESLQRDSSGRFVAQTPSGDLSADAVVVATGFREHAYLPEDVTALLPRARFGHTCEVVDFAPFRGKSVAIVGGRQSAFESAALLAKAGAAEVHVIHRHPTPEFAPSDWSWVEPLMHRTQMEPGWYGRLSEDERKDLDARFWTEGRRKLEPWLAPRLSVPAVRLWPERGLEAAEVDGERVNLRLTSGEDIAADFVLLATGYRYDIANLPFLAQPLRGDVQVRNGFPVLDTAFQSSVPGLYFTSMAATQDFGSFFAFTVSVRAGARLIARSLA